MSLAAEELGKNKDILFVVAAGNLGPSLNTVSSPGCAPGVLTVGAVDRDNTTANFSSRGPAIVSHTLKPEIAAPGVAISAAVAGGRGTDAYRSLSGTSMAAPHVAGAAAVVKQRHPDWTAQQIKAALVSSARSAVPGDVRETGGGRLDVDRAVRTPVLGAPAVQGGTFNRPQDRSDRTTVVVPYTNTSGQPVTLSLKVAGGTGNDGSTVRSTIASLGRKSVTVSPCPPGRPSRCPSRRLPTPRDAAHSDPCARHIFPMSRFRAAFAVDNMGMSQQGEKPAAHEDDWWRKLYDETAHDTGPGRAADSLDDRFDSVSGTVSSPVGDHRAAVPETVRDPYGDAYEDPYADRYEEPDADRDEDPYADAYRPPPERSRPVVAQRERLPDCVPDPVPGSVPDPVPDPEAAPELMPDPRSAWDAYAKRDRQPERAADAEPERNPAPAPEPDRQPERATDAEPEPEPPPVPVPKRNPVPDSAAPAGPEPAAPRTTVFPAPWEAPAGQPGPRTFAAPRVPEAPEHALAPDPSALHTLPPDPADGEATGGRPSIGHLGDRPPTYDAEPAALPSATSENLDGLAPDTVLDGARYGTYTLRTASVRGDSARFRGETRRDGLLTARFGAAESALVLVAVAGGDRAGEAAHLAAADACRWIGGAVARSHLRLSEDIRAGRRDDLRAGLHRLTDRTYGKLRARAAELGIASDAYTASLRCLLLSADPDCRTRVFFGVGSGGLFRLRDGRWQDLEPHVPEGGGPPAGDEQEEGPDGDRLTMDLQIAAPSSPNADGPARQPAEPFRFRASVARPGDTLLLCSNGLAEPMRGEPALPGELAERWGTAGPPGLPAFLADTQLRIKGYADDRTCAAVWEA